MIVVDSSVWIDYLRGTDTPQAEKLDILIGQKSLIVGDVILCEVLLGVSSEREARTVENALRQFDLVPMLGVEQALRAAALYRTLRSKGITIRKTVDLIIGAWCIAHGAMLLHKDRDFTLLEQHAGLTPA
jgi:hypothetical protein